MEILIFISGVLIGGFFSFLLTVYFIAKSNYEQNKKN